RREVEVATERPQFGGEDAARCCCILGRTGCAQRQVAWQLGGATGNGHQLAALLIDAQQWRRLTAAARGVEERLVESPELRKVAEVVAEQAHAGHTAIAYSPEDPGRSFVPSKADQIVRHSAVPSP